MRGNIPQEYLDAFADPKRWRLQYMVLHWPDGDQYIAGSRFEYSGGKYCDALVVDWGNLSDTVDVEAAISGTGSQTRQASVTLANTSETGWWCSRFSTPPENLSVDLYQAVEGVGTHLLIGRFIVQSPIDYSEAEGTVTLTLLSVNQRIDPYIGSNELPFIVGCVKGLIGKIKKDIQYAKVMSFKDGEIVTDQLLSSNNWNSKGTLYYLFKDGGDFYITGVGISGIDGEKILIPSRETSYLNMMQTGDYVFPGVGFAEAYLAKPASVGDTQLFFLTGTFTLLDLSDTLKLDLYSPTI